ncbi:hypothetical protein [Nesterenkonia halobia]|uniref:Uncharacterized protein n=1 Tax=Nesterenkonia halobia TaxID=37922 RepID=A0ABP6RFG8_9MICC
MSTPDITPAAWRDAFGYIQLWMRDDHDARRELLELGGMPMVDVIVGIFENIADRQGQDLEKLADAWRLTHEQLQDATDREGVG